MDPRVTDGTDMYVCICEAITERDVQGAIQRGCDSVDDVKTVCGAGGSCGSCQPRIQRMLDARERRKSLRRVELPLAAK